MNETQQDQYLQAQKLIAEEKWQEASDILEDLIGSFPQPFSRLHS